MATKIDLAVSMVLDSKGVAVGFRDVKNKVRDLEGQFMKMNDTLKEVKRGTEGFQAAASTAMETYQRQTRTAGTATSNLKSKLDDLFKPITTLNQAFGLLQQSLYVVNRAFQLTVGSAIDLELQVARINTVLDESERGQVDFAKQILQMQATFGANPTEAAKGFYEAIASGATNAAGSIELMATAQRLAIGGLLPLDKALSGLTAVMASYGYTAEQTKFISDGFFIAAAKGKTNVEELTQEIGNVSSIAQQSGVSFAELAASISAVTLGGKRTAEATTSVRSAINALLTPTEQLQYVYNQLGIESVTAAIKQRGLQAVYQDIYKYTNYNVEALSKLVGRIEAVPAVVALTTGKQKQAYDEMLSSITDNTKKMGEVTENAFNIIAQTASHRMEVAKGAISASLTAISSAFTVILTPLVEIGAKILSAILKPLEAASAAFVAFSKSTNENVIPSLVAVGVAFAALKFSTTITSIGAITASLSALSVSLVAVGTSAAIAAGKFAIIAASVVAVTAVVDLFVRNISLIPDMFAFVMTNIIKYSAKVIEVFQELKEALGFETNLVQTRIDIQNLETASIQASQRIQKNFSGGMFKGAIDGVKAFASAFDSVQQKTAGGVGGTTKPQEKGQQGAAPDIAAGVESAKKAMEAYNALVQRTGDLQIKNNIGNLKGAALIDAQLKGELSKVNALEKQLFQTNKFSKEKENQIKQDFRNARSALEKEAAIQKQVEGLNQLDSLMKSTASLEQQNMLANLEGLDLIEAQYQIELDKITAIEQQLALTGALGEEQKKQIAQARAAAESGKDVSVGKEQKKQAQETVGVYTDLINSAAGGANALVGNVITQIGKAFGPEGQMIAGIINLLRMGGDFMKNLGSELIKIIIELPLMLAEGIVGLVEGLLNGVINMLSDPAKLAKITTSISTVFQKVITAIAKALPQILKMLLNPDFWIELATQIVRSLWDAFIEMVYAIGDLLASIFSGEVFEPVDEATNTMGTKVNEGIKYATDALTGVSDQMFAVMEDVPTQKTGRNAMTADSSSIGKEIKKANKETSVVWKWIQNNIIEPLKKAGQWIGSGIEAAWKFAERVIGSVLVPVARMIGKAIETAMNFVKLTFNLVSNGLKMTWNGIIAVLKGAWDIIIIAWKTSIEYLKAVWDGLMSVLKAVWDAIISIITSVWEYIKVGFEALWNTAKAIFEAIWETAKTVFNVIVEVFKSAWEVAKSVFDIIVTAFKAMWDTAKAIFDVIIVAFKATWDALKAIFDPIIVALKGVWDFVKSIFDVIISAFKAIWEFVKTLFDNPIKAFKELWQSIKDIFAKVIEAFKGIWDTIKNIFASIIDAFKAVWEAAKKIFSAIGDALGTVWNGAKKIFDGIGTALSSVWDGAKKIFDAIVKTFEKAWEGIKGIFSSIGDGLSKSWDKLKDVGSSLWEGMKNIGSKVMGWFSDAGNAIWGGIEKGWGSIKETFTKLGDTIWDGIKSAFANIKNFFKELFAFDGGGTGAVEEFLGFDFPWFAFAEGGKVPGTPKVMGDSNKNDTVAALLSPGEFVIPRSKMQDPNNLVLIDAIMSGGKAVDWIQKALFGGVEKKSSGGAIGNNSYGKWLSKAQSGGIEFHALEWKDLDPTNKDSAVRAILRSIDPTNPKSTVGNLVQGAWRGIKQAGSFLGDLFVPDWIQKIWDSVSKYLKELDLKELVKNPWKAIKKALKLVLEGANFLTEPFKKMMSFDNKDKGGGKANNTFDSNNPNYAKDLSPSSYFQEFLDNAFNMALKATQLSDQDQAIANTIAFTSRYNSGGLVPGYGFKDNVPAMLTPGEFVMNRNAVNSLGIPLLNQLNAGMAPSTSQAPVFNINLNIETKEAIDETFIRQKLVPTIKQEIRSSSLRGEFIVSAKGVKL